MGHPYIDPFWQKLLYYRMFRYKTISSDNLAGMCGDTLPTTLAFRRTRQDCQQLETSLDFIARPCLKHNEAQKLYYKPLNFSENFLGM